MTSKPLARMITSAGIVTSWVGAELVVILGSGCVLPGPSVTDFSSILVIGKVVSSIAGSLSDSNPIDGLVYFSVLVVCEKTLPKTSSPKSKEKQGQFPTYSPYHKSVVCSIHHNPV